VIQSINGLQPELRAHTLNRRATNPIRPNASAPNLVGYPASTFVAAYGGDHYANSGEGSTTAIVIDTFPLASDLKLYWTLTNTPQTLKNVSFIQAVKGQNDPPSGEESMDTEITSSIAPKSKVRVYASSTLSFVNIDSTYERIIADMKGGQQVDQVSISLGACETDVPRAQEKTDDNYFAVLSSLGASVFVSSGDSGSLECDSDVDTPSFFSTSPNVTAVGGTALNYDKKASEPYTETAWQGSGGGVSVRFKKPGYQKSLDYAGRAVPDVSADADPNTGAMVILAGVPMQIGGTSLSAPIWAGLTALVNSERHANGKGALGLINKTTTKLQSTTSFRDVTEGDNIGYNAGPGFDLVTGVGSPLLDTLGPKLEAKP
jgi:kumamolisin